MDLGDLEEDNSQTCYVDANWNLLFLKERTIMLRYLWRNYCNNNDQNNNECEMKKCDSKDQII